MIDFASFLLLRKVNSSLRRDKAKLHLPENLPLAERIFFQSLVLKHRREQLWGQRKRKSFYTKSFIQTLNSYRHERNS